jgi:hypothetical protein
VLTEAFFQCREQCPYPTSSRCKTALILAANSDSHWNRPWWWTSAFLFLFFPRNSLLLPQLPYCINLALVHGFTHLSPFSGQWCKEFPFLSLARTHPYPNLAPRQERTGRGSKAKQIIQLIHRQLRREIRRCSKTLNVKVVPQLLLDKFIHTVVLVTDLSSYGNVPSEHRSGGRIRGGGGGDRRVHRQRSLEAPNREKLLKLTIWSNVWNGFRTCIHEGLRESQLCLRYM